MNTPTPFNHRRPKRRKNNVPFMLVGGTFIFALNGLATAAGEGGSTFFWSILAFGCAVLFWALGAYDGMSTAMQRMPWVGKVTDEDLDAIIQHCRREAGDRTPESEHFNMVVTQEWMRQMLKFGVISLVRIDPDAHGYEIEGPVGHESNEQPKG